MAQKCVHKGCGKVFSDPEEPCVYHPGPPEFHEGQKGWKCCKPRVLTFDEFLTIPPCTTGKHSTVDDTPAPKPVAKDEPPAPALLPVASQAQAAPDRLPQPTESIPRAPSPVPEPESEDDDSSLPIPANTTCRRRSCNEQSTATTTSHRTGEKCIFHPGHPIFHEGSKGWTCCKRRVLEFDEFMRIEGCETKDKHMFVGSGKKSKESGATEGGEKLLETVRHDFYQSSTTVHASLFLRKIMMNQAKVHFRTTEIEVDLPTCDKTRYKAVIPLFGPIDPKQSSKKFFGTKLELMLVKTDGRSWPVFRADERTTGEIIQTGKAGRV